MKSADEAERQIKLLRDRVAELERKCMRLDETLCGLISARSQAQPPSEFVRVSTTERGFVMLQFDDVFRMPCSLQASSYAHEAAVWFGSDICDVSGLSNRMHLTTAMVRQLLPYLERFAHTGHLDERVDTSI